MHACVVLNDKLSKFLNDIFLNKKKYWKDIFETSFMEQRRVQVKFRATKFNSVQINNQEHSALN